MYPKCFVVHLLIYTSLLIYTISLFSCVRRNKILIDGSSTVYPISEAIAEEYHYSDQKIISHVLIGTSGTGGGFKKFCSGKLDITNVSRPIKNKEISLCRQNKIDYIIFKVAYDGLAIIVNKGNHFLNEVTVKDLEYIFREKDYAISWNDLKSSLSFSTIKVYSPGQDSGTYDYFIETILGTDSGMRPKSMFSEDDNILVTGVSGDLNGIGFLGLAYFIANQDQIKLLPVVNPKTKQNVLPNSQTVQDGTYFPLSRPLFIYVKKYYANEKKRKSIIQFVKFYFQEISNILPSVGYVPLSNAEYAKESKKISLLVPKVP